MGLRQDRNKAHDAVLEGRFIEHTLKNHAQAIDNDIARKQTSVGFRSAFWQNRNFETNANLMVYKHTKQHRFIDMRTRRSQDGSVNKKKSYPHHNRILYGQANNLVRELAFGFVATVKEEMAQLIKNKNL